MIEYLETFKLTLRKTVNEELSKIPKDTDMTLNNANAELAKKNMGLTIISEKEIPKNINHFLDSRIPFESRFSEIKEKKEEKEALGEIYHEKFLTLIKMIMEDCNPYLWGNSGEGKTFMINQAFELLGLDYRPINKILKDYDIIGLTLPNGEYTNPLWYQCYKFGYGVFLDEFDRCSNKSKIVINSFTSNREGSFYSFPNQEIVYCHPNFRIVAAGNTSKLDEVVIQKFMPLHINEDSHIEKEILKNYPEWFEFVQNFRKASYVVERSLKLSELTTRDTSKIKQLKDNKSFSDEEIIDYEIIGNKNDNYLNSLVNILDKYYQNGNEESNNLYKIFKQKVKKIR
jgi:MoxR-like ATPase